jgi:hypothetical protein
VSDEKPKYRIVKVQVEAERLFPHPDRSYSNQRVGLRLEATVQPGADPVEVVMDLQAQAEELVEDHMARLADWLKHSKNNYDGKGARRHIRRKQKPVFGDTDPPAERRPRGSGL